ncbi:MAG: hypothetical protein RBS02_17230 [Steroidobacteraceae bacterium]|jgi:hypothetical protein|nr:hypothetical protein [Steroidobacteraceae bacterium]
MNAKSGQGESNAVAYPELAESLHAIASKERAARMIEVNIAYAQCFMDGDFEGMLDYLVEVPVFEMYPQAIRITGREAVLERSKRLFPLASQNDSRTAHSHRITACTAGSDVLIHEFSNIYKLADGTSRRCYTVAVIPFVGDRMVGERVYSDQYLGRLREQLLGADFLARPDVTIL